MEANRERSREEGSTLILTAIAVVVILSLVSAMVMVSAKGSQATAAMVGRTSAWYGAAGGIWASANSLNNGGTGNIFGNYETGSYLAQVAADSDSDNFQDFSSDTFFKTKGDGYFEARAYDVEGDASRYLIRARAIQDGEIKTLEGLANGESGPPGVSRPFSRGGFGRLKFHMDSNVFTDSYDGDVNSYQGHATTATDNGNPIKNQNGHIGSNGDISLDSNAKVYGDARPGPSGSVTTNGSASVSGDTTPLTSPEGFDPPSWTVPSTSDTSALLGVSHGSSYSESRGSKTITVSGTQTVVLSKLQLDGRFQLTVEGTKSDTLEIYITGGASAASAPSFVMDSNSKFFVTSTNTSNKNNEDDVPTVKIYNVGKLEFSSNSRLNADTQGNSNLVGRPIKLQYYSTYDSNGNAGDVGVHFNSNNDRSMVVYAPDAYTSWDSNSQFWGAIVSAGIEFNSNAFLHYDESLGNLQVGSAPTPTKYYVPQMFRELR